MSIQTLRSQLEEYAKDIKLNLGSVLDEDGAPGLTQKQIIGVALASAYSTKHSVVISELLEEASNHLNDNEINAAKIAATLMAMNNVYYRFLHLVSNDEYKKMPANLRMNAIQAHGIEKLDFELMSLAVSIINGCGMCIDAHERAVKKLDAPATAVQSAARIASVINAVAQAFTIEGK